MSTNTNHSHKVTDEAALKELLSRDLAILHRNNQTDEDELYKLIKNSYLDHHAYDWSENANTAIPELQHAKAILEGAESGNPFVGLPPYMDKNMSDWHALMGMVSREKHLQNMGASDDSNPLSSVVSHFDVEELKNVAAE
ncbi:hypothetical protein DER45DRAFT_543162 [Fusarium avenaceum]|nr:hypothetical protein DER45DRAFT_543162 [Fusarium avenaceum]